MSAPLDSDAGRWIDDWERSAAAQADRARDLAAEVAAVEARASSLDGAIEVTVGPSGALLDLRLGEPVRRYQPAELAAEILAVTRRAQAGLAARVADVAGRTLGPDSPTARAVVAGYEQRFPAPDEPGQDGQRRRTR